MNRPHMHLADSHHFDMGTNLLRQLIAILGNADAQLATDSLFQSGQVDILACRKLCHVCCHTLVHLGVRHHNGVAVNAAEQDLFFD